MRRLNHESGRHLREDLRDVCKVRSRVHLHKYEVVALGEDVGVDLARPLGGHEQIKPEVAAFPGDLRVASRYLASAGANTSFCRRAESLILEASVNSTSARTISPSKRTVWSSNPISTKPSPVGPRRTPAVTNAIGGVRIVLSSRRETGPKAKTTLASTASSTTVGFRNVEDYRTKEVQKGRLSPCLFAAHAG
jgi:hypothetical protein